MFISEGLRQAAATRRRVVREMMRRRNVVACGVGYKLVGMKPTAVPSVIVSVTRKMPVSMLDDSDVVPQMVEDVPTDVVETGVIRALALNRRARLRPLRPGISVAHLNGSAGTLGCIVRRGGELFALSNNHVLAVLNEASLGDAILQPGPGDGGSLLDQVGELASFMPLRFLDEAVGSGGEPKAATKEGLLLSKLLELLRAFKRPLTAEPVTPGPPQNYVDAAIARLSDPTQVELDIVDVGGAPLGVTDPVLGMRVIKSGRTTGLTQGTIVQLDVTVDVRYGARTGRFVEQFMTTPFSKPGDSGSLVLDYERRAVGLLFSGSDMISVVNPIQAVLKAFKIELVTES